MTSTENVSMSIGFHLATHGAIYALTWESFVGKVVKPTAVIFTPNLCPPSRAIT